MAKSVKLSDIAEKLGVSKVTVSKALSNQKGVSEEMRRKIKELAAELGYVSPSSSKLSRDAKSYNIGILVAERYFDQTQSFYWSMYQEAAIYALSKNSFTMLEVVSSTDEEDCNVPKLIESDKINGIIIIGIMNRAYLDMMARQNDIPVVYLDFYEPEARCESIVSDSFFGMYYMTDYLCRNGHRKIAYVGTVRATNSITDRYMGYCKALLEHDIDLRKDYVIDDRYPGTGSRTGYKLKLPKDMPTAFACNCDVVALELIDLLEEKGYRVPEDISVVGFDNYAFSNKDHIELSTYAVDFKAMAKLAVKKLLKKMDGDMFVQAPSVVEGRMIPGKTVKNIER